MMVLRLGAKGRDIKVGWNQAKAKAVKERGMQVKEVGRRKAQGARGSKGREGRASEARGWWKRAMRGQEVGRRNEE